MKTGMRIIYGVAGVLLITTAACLVFFAAAAAFGSYYDGAPTLFGVIPGSLFALGRHLVAHCFPSYEKPSLTTTIGDYLGDTLVAMGMISALDGSWAHDAEASSVATLLLLGGAAVYFCIYLLPWIRRNG